MSWRSARRPALAAAAAAMLGGALFPPLSWALDLSDNVQLHGFAGQAYVSTTDNRYFGPSDSGVGSFEFTELGLNLSWQALPRLQFAGQAGYRKAGNTEEAKPRIDYALADVSLYDGANAQGGIRAGRYRNAYGLYNETRDVANARPSIFLPSLYNDASRDLQLSMDGAQAYGEVRTDFGDFFLHAGGGKLLLGSDQKEIISADTSYMARLMYEFEGGRLRLALTALDAHFDFKIPGLQGQELRVHTDQFASAQYNAENWSLTAEYAPTTIQVGDPALLTVDGLSYYVQGTYRIAPRWEALLRYDVKYADKNDRSGAAYAAATGLPAYSRFAKDWTLGLSWQLRPDTKLRAEWHHLDGTAWLSTREDPNPLNTKENWNLFALQASYNF